MYYVTSTNLCSGVSKAALKSGGQFSVLSFSDVMIAIHVWCTRK